MNSWKVSMPRICRMVLRTAASSSTAMLRPASTARASRRRRATSAVVYQRWPPGERPRVRDLAAWRDAAPSPARSARSGRSLVDPGPEKVRPGPPGIAGARDLERGVGRRELADWLVSPDNPMTSRVFANRVWQWLFGRGIVEKQVKRPFAQQLVRTALKEGLPNKALFEPAMKVGQLVRPLLPGALKNKVPEARAAGAALAAS